MKTKLLLIAIILSLSSPALLKAQTAYEWDYVNTLQNEWLQKICTQGLDTVYVVGKNGLIAQSTDRALTWNKQYPVTSQLNDIIFCNHTTGFAVGNNGIILKTTDAGINWTAQISGTTYNLNAIAATGLDNIWAVGDSGIILHSLNFGNSWEKIDITNRKISLNDIDFKNNNGFIVGDTTVVLKTINKGDSWTDNSLTSTESFFSLSMTENKAFVLVGDKLNSNYNNLSTILITNKTGNFEINNFLPRSHGLISLNDSLFLMSAYMVPTGAPPASKSITLQNNTNSYSGLHIYSFYINEGYSIQSSFFTPSFSSSYNQHTGFPQSFCFANDSIGYFISGQMLLKTPSLLGVGINDCRYNPRIKITQAENELIINSTDKDILMLEILDINGKIYKTIANANSNNKTVVNISATTHGSYIIRILFSDKSFYNYKWVRQ